MSDDGPRPSASSAAGRSAGTEARPEIRHDAGPSAPPRRSTLPNAPRVGTRAIADVRVTDRTCPVCEHSLRGLPFEAPCPECGAVVGDTARELDGPLALAPFALIRHMTVAASLGAVGAIVAWLSMFAGLVGAFPGEAVAWGYVIGAMIWAAGVWLVSAPHLDPVAAFNGFAAGDRWRRAARVLSPAVPLLAGVSTIPWVLDRLPGPGAAAPGPVLNPVNVTRATPEALQTIASVEWILVPIAFAGFTLGLAMFARVARWTRDDTAEHLMAAGQWGMPLVGIVAMSFGAGLIGRFGVAPPDFTMRGSAIPFVAAAAMGVVPIGLLSLSFSAGRSRVHADEAREVAARRAARRAAEAERIGAKARATR